jgi:PadR family transcriptional regulator
MRLTVPMVKVVSAMLAAPEDDHYGLQLMKTTGLLSGTLYPLLQRLEQVGWVEAEWEDIDPVKEARPARRYYRFTANGTQQARTALAELHEAMAPAARVQSKASPAW